MTKHSRLKTISFVILVTFMIMTAFCYRFVFIRVVYGDFMDDKDQTNPFVRCPSNGGHTHLGHACGRVFDKFPYTYQYRVASKDDCEETIVLSDKDLPLTALASHPGAGNTWMRYLLQQATGVATGSVYCDLTLKRNGFFADGVRNSSVIAIKTHIPFKKHMSCFDQAIVLVRDPRDTILSYFNWSHLKSHIDQTSEPTFSTEWMPFWTKQSEKWQQFHKQWLNFPRRILVVHFECLKQNLNKELSRIVDFLGFKIPEDKMKCLVANNQGQFLRNKNLTISERRKIHLRSVYPDQIIYEMYSDVYDSAKLLNSTQKQSLEQFMNTQCQY